MYTFRYLILAAFLALGTSSFISKLTAKSNVEPSIQSYQGYKSALDIISSEAASCPNNINPFVLEKIPGDWPQKSQSSMSVVEKKNSFFVMMLPLSIEANNSVLALRKKLESMKGSRDRFDSKTKTFLTSTAATYRVQSKGLSDGQVLAKLLRKVDSVPNSIVLAQAAYESAYGSSRFAIEGNSLFGQWSYKSGIKPKEQRTSTKGDYRVASFDSLLQTFDSYLVNLNTSNAYIAFRDIRYKERQSNAGFDPMQLTVGLKKYSERGQYYVDTLNSIIKSNKLLRFDDCSFNSKAPLLLKDSGEALGH